ncbi:MAG: hypothetical protein ACFFCJ_08985 [Promethearchaeota archaeon]
MGALVRKCSVACQLRWTYLRPKSPGPVAGWFARVRIWCAADRIQSVMAGQLMPDAQDYYTRWSAVTEVLLARML